MSELIFLIFSICSYDNNCTDYYYRCMDDLGVRPSLIETLSDYEEMLLPYQVDYCTRRYQAK